VPLDDELAIVEAYLAIERARFEERLAVTVDADDAARRVLVPPLLLQPLVENAVKHGVAPLRAARRPVSARVEPAAGAAARAPRPRDRRRRGRRRGDARGAAAAGLRPRQRGAPAERSTAARRRSRSTPGRGAARRSS
jgi:hypothetical protein